MTKGTWQEGDRQYGSAIRQTLLSCCKRVEPQLPGAQCSLLEIYQANGTSHKTGTGNCI